MNSVPPMKIVAVVQARMGSTRLPGKVIKSINGVPMIQLLLQRLSKSELIDQIVVATPLDKANLPLCELVTKLGFKCEQGSETDVLDRVILAAERHGADVVVRITADCPLVDPAIVDVCIKEFLDQGVDYCSNTAPPTYPDGLDVEVVRLSSLKESAIATQSRYDREHVTPYIRQSGCFKKCSILFDQDLSMRRWTVDDNSDFEVVRNIFEHFSPDIHFSWQQIERLFQTEPHLFAMNQHTKRNEGSQMGTGQKLWQRAKHVIPGGNMLLSKRPEMFLPNFWPAYFSKAKGCRVWDLDGDEYVDMSIMGIGTNSLGYGQEEVDQAVLGIVTSGNMSTLNCPEEVYLAERLVDLHPWAEMVRFARSGGEANAIAVRIARAATGKDKIAVCGYHGWHDWYLSANLADQQGLDGHLLPGLEPNGVPRYLKGTVLTFNYNRFDELLNIVQRNEIGAIVMEVMRNSPPEENFLEQVRELATNRGIVLIFDECTSGFRESFGGIHKNFGVEPDIAMFGKALGNGYAINAVIGRREIMEATQTTFVSSTFWTERIGPTAALKTLEVMEQMQSWMAITETGLQIRRRWQEMANSYHLNVIHWGLPALTGFSFQSENALAYKTLITQEMLAKGYLASNCVYVCTEHTASILDGYFERLDPVFKLIQQCEMGDLNIYDLLRGPICHNGFKRLN